MTMIHYRAAIDKDGIVLVYFMHSPLFGRTFCQPLKKETIELIADNHSDVSEHDIPTWFREKLQQLQTALTTQLPNIIANGMIILAETNLGHPTTASCFDDFHNKTTFQQLVATLPIHQDHIQRLSLTGTSEAYNAANTWFSGEQKWHPHDRAMSKIARETMDASRGMSFKDEYQRMQAAILPDHKQKFREILQKKSQQHTTQENEFITQENSLSTHSILTDEMKTSLEHDKPRISIFNCFISLFSCCHLLRHAPIHTYLDSSQKNR